MQFHSPQLRDNAIETDQFETGNSKHPVLFVSRDRQSVFVQECREQSPMKIHLADRDEICDLWEKYRILALLAVLHRTSKSPAADSELSGMTIWRAFHHQEYQNKSSTMMA